MSPTTTAQGREAAAAAAAITQRLPDDLLADVLRRVPPRGVAACRCACRAWRDLVDARRLLRADLLPRSVGGIFISYCTLLSPEFFARPTTGRPVDGDLELFIPDDDAWTVTDHCGGLLLCNGSEGDCVANPATRRWARLPPRPASRMGGVFYQNQIQCLAYDPTVSPHYRVISIPCLPYYDEPKSVLSPEMLQSEWPPPSYPLQVFSSATGQWEERTFVREEGCANGTIIARMTKSELRDWLREAVYWREALYIFCNNFSIRMSLSNEKYRLISSPGNTEGKHYAGPLGVSVEGLYCAVGLGWHGLSIYLLNESSDKTCWELKHRVDLMSFARKLNAFHDHREQQRKEPWILRDINYYKYPYGNDKQREAVDDNFEWSSDDDDVLSPEDMVEGHFYGHARFLGFHPYKEVVFLDVSLSRAVAYHWNSSKFQDLGDILPTEYDAGHVAGIDNSFIYTPCWVEDFPENNLQAQLEE